MLKISFFLLRMKLIFKKFFLFHSEFDICILLALEVGKLISLQLFDFLELCSMFLKLTLIEFYINTIHNSTKFHKNRLSICKT
jgi:hypothetical protein